MYITTIYEWLSNSICPLDPNRMSIFSPYNNTPFNSYTDLNPNYGIGVMLSCSGGGLMSFFKGLTTGKVVSREAMTPVLEKLMEHLIKKNVAVEIADKLCASVATKLDGKVISNFTGMYVVYNFSIEAGLHHPCDLHLLWLCAMHSQ